MPMDIQKALSELYEEKKRLDWTISTLEARLKNIPSLSRSRRGRKSMGEDERLKVSERMSAYWAGRRAAKRAAQATSLQPSAAATGENFLVFEQPGSGSPAQSLEETRLSA